MSREVTVADDRGTLARLAAAHIAQAAVQAVADRGVFTVCLSGGETPKATYELLAGEAGRHVPWDRVHVFWGDERCVPLERPDNHYTMVRELVLSHVPIPQENVHRIRAEIGDTALAAEQYERMLRSFFGSRPDFDILLLGMGDDGHTASLYPGSPGCTERVRWVVAHDVVKKGECLRRVTLTVPALVAAREVLFLVAGLDKAEALAAVLADGADVPARWVEAKALNVRWMVDREAASLLDERAVISR